MFSLKILGGASLEGPEGPLTGRAVQRRRLALLALLALSRTPGVGRDKLVALLWPDSDVERARHLLSDTVYVINRALGGEAVGAVADELRLNAGRLTCDARAFEEAVDRGELEEAVRIYAGPFLDGFFVDGCEELERWMASERQRLQDAYSRTLERLAQARGEHGDDRGAIDAWRRLSAVDPYNSRVACELAQALKRTGDRAGALQQLQAHADTLHQELGLAPPDTLIALVHTLRAAPSTPRPPAVLPASVDLADAPVVDAPPPIAVVEPSAPAASTAPMPTSAHAAGRRRRVAVVAAAAMLIALAAGLRIFWPKASAADTPRAPQSVAVLPFADLSASRDQEYFGDGVAEELSTRLARVPGLKVAARTSAFSFKGSGTDAKTIGRALNVDALLEGSVRQEHGRVRIAVRLVDARDGYQIWADSWDRGNQDMLAVQDEIATGVLAALRTGAGAPLSAAPRTVDPVAYDLYLQGRYFWHQRTRDSLTRAASAFDRAVVLAPDYAAAHSGVADAYAVLGFYDFLPPLEAGPRAKAAARRALELDPRSAEAYASLGYVALYFDWDWVAAEQALRRATELNPSYSIGHQWLANYFVARGRFADAVVSMRKAQNVDPLSLIASAALGWAQYYQRDYDAAVQQCRRTIALNGNFLQAWVWGGLALEASGRYADALEMLEKAAALSNRSPVVLASLGRTQALAGHTGAARAIVREIEHAQGAYVPPFEMAKLRLALGDRAQAMTWLWRAHEQRSHSMVFLAVDPQLDALRDDAEFKKLAQKVGAASE